MLFADRHQPRTEGPARCRCVRGDDFDLHHANGKRKLRLHGPGKSCPGFIDRVPRKVVQPVLSRPFQRRRPGAAENLGLGRNPGIRRLYLLPSKSPPGGRPSRPRRQPTWWPFSSAPVRAGSMPSGSSSTPACRSTTSIAKSSSAPCGMPDRRRSSSDCHSATRGSKLERWFSLDSGAPCERASPASLPPVADELTHFDESGASRMVDVGDKAVTDRRARASGRVRMEASTLGRIRDRRLSKGDVLEVARLAGIMAAKRAAS